MTFYFSRKKNYRGPVIVLCKSLGIRKIRPLSIERQQAFSLGPRPQTKLRLSKRMTWANLLTEVNVSERCKLLDELFPVGMYGNQMNEDDS